MNTARVLGFSVLGIIFSFWLNYSILDPIIIPDICAYHVKQPGPMIRLFYNFPSWNGSHPWPSLLNWGLTLSTGIGLGILVTKLTRRKKETE